MDAIQLSQKESLLCEDKEAQLQQDAWKEPVLKKRRDKTMSVTVRSLPWLLLLIVLAWELLRFRRGDAYRHTNSQMTYSTSVYISYSGTSPNMIR